jgi:hypothetical protein
VKVVIVCADKKAEDRYPQAKRVLTVALCPATVLRILEAEIKEQI